MLFLNGHASVGRVYSVAVILAAPGSTRSSLSLSSALMRSLGSEELNDAARQCRISELIVRVAVGDKEFVAFFFR